MFVVLEMRARARETVEGVVNDIGVTALLASASTVIRNSNRCSPFRRVSQLKHFNAIATKNELVDFVSSLRRLPVHLLLSGGFF